MQKYQELRIWTFAFTHWASLAAFTLLLLWGLFGGWGESLEVKSDIVFSISLLCLSLWFHISLYRWAYVCGYKRAYGKD